MQKAPFYQSHIYRQIKILRTLFEKGHPRNIPVKLFQNLTSSFGEDILRISSCPYSARCPIHQSYVYGRIKILQTIFEKVHPRNIPVKLFQNLTSSFQEKDFLRISLCPYSARSPYSPELCLWTDQNFANNFWKGSPKEHYGEIILKSDQLFLWRRFFKNYLKNSISLPWQLEFMMESNSVNNFWRGSPKEHSCQVWSKLAQRFGRRRCLKKLLMTHDGHFTTLKAPLEHVVLRWTKNAGKQENAGTSFPQCFQPIQEQIPSFEKQKFQFFAV